MKKLLITSFVLFAAKANNVSLLQEQQTLTMINQLIKQETRSYNYALKIRLNMGDKIKALEQSVKAGKGFFDILFKSFLESCKNENISINEIIKLMPQISNSRNDISKQHQDLLIDAFNCIHLNQVNASQENELKDLVNKQNSTTKFINHTFDRLRGLYWEKNTLEIQISIQQK